MNDYIKWKRIRQQLQRPVDDGGGTLSVEEAKQALNEVRILLKEAHEKAEIEVIAALEVASQMLRDWIWEQEFDDVGRWLQMHEKDVIKPA